ncbi:MAG TPA: hypothetical protein VF540_07140 [Segetibacter sp.]
MAVIFKKLFVTEPSANTELIELEPLSKFDRRLLTLAIVFISVGIIVFILAAVIFLHKETINSSKINSGKFGDFGSFLSGSVGALWTLVGALLFYVALRLQRKELALQRQELKDTRDELKRSANAQENSERALNRQAENLKISAKLAALNTLVTYYSELELNKRKGIHSQLELPEIIERKLSYVRRIEEILETKENLI